MERRNYVSLAFWSRERREALESMTEPAETEHLAQVLVLPARPSLLERQDELEAEGHIPGAAA